MYIYIHPTLKRAFPDAPERFLTKIRVTPKCWEWTAGHNGLGYGFRLDDRLQYSHRLAYEWAVGPIADGVFIRHKCDNPKCCNYRHLIPGTQQDNIDDMHRRGRDRKNASRGEKAWNAKLTAAHVKEIRKDHRILRLIAEDYNVSISTIWFVRAKKHWAHI